METVRHLQLWEMEEKEDDNLSMSSYKCPCKRCMSGKILSRTTIRQHLRQHKRDQGCHASGRPRPRPADVRTRPMIPRMSAGRRGRPPRPSDGGGRLPRPPGAVRNCRPSEAVHLGPSACAVRSL
jgi:hypothetical protein